MTAIYLESLVLEHALNGSVLTRGRELGLEDNAEGAVSHNLALSILHVSSFSSNTILNLFANDL